MHVLNIVTSPRKHQSVSRAIVDAFLREYMKQADDTVIDTLDVWQEWLPEFDAETINAKYKGVSGEPVTPAEVTAWEKISELASRFRGYPTQAGYPLIDPATAPRWAHSRRQCYRGVPLWAARVTGHTAKPHERRYLSF
jgi:Flavodoxin-like fold